MSWQIFILLSTVFYSVSIIIQRHILKGENSNPIAFGIIFQFIVGIFIAFYGFIFGNISFEKFGPLFINLILVVVAYSLLNIFCYKSLKETEASKFTIIFAARALFVTVVTLLILNETPMFKHIFGALLILTGIILTTPKALKLKFTKGELYAFFAAIIFGFATVNDRFVLRYVDVYSYTSFAFIGPGILMSLIFSRQLKFIPIFLSKSNLPKLIVLCILFAANAVFYFLAMQKGNSASQVVSVGLISVIIIVLLSVIFLKERTNMLLKIIGSIVSFAGLLLVS